MQPDWWWSKVGDASETSSVLTWRLRRWWRENKRGETGSSVQNKTGWFINLIKTINTKQLKGHIPFKKQKKKTAGSSCYSATGGERKRKEPLLVCYGRPEGLQNQTNKPKKRERNIEKGHFVSSTLPILTWGSRRGRDSEEVWTSAVLTWSTGGSLVWLTGRSIIKHHLLGLEGGVFWRLSVSFFLPWST